MLKLYRRIKFILNIRKSIPFLMEFFKSKEVKQSRKIWSAVLFVGYLLFPFDIIPDIFGLIGFVDDAAILAFILQRIVEMAPQSLRDKYDV